MNERLKVQKKTSKQKLCFPTKRWLRNHRPLVYILRKLFRNLWFVCSHLHQILLFLAATCFTTRKNSFIHLNLDFYS